LQQHQANFGSVAVNGHTVAVFFNSDILIHRELQLIKCTRKNRIDFTVKSDHRKYEWVILLSC
jgi:hypothetical protein